MSHSLLVITQWCDAYKCWNTDLNCDTTPVTPPTSPPHTDMKVRSLHGIVEKCKYGTNVNMPVVCRNVNCQHFILAICPRQTDVLQFQQWPTINLWSPVNDVLIIIIIIIMMIKIFSAELQLLGNSASLTVLHQLHWWARTMWLPQALCGFKSPAWCLQQWGSGTNTQTKSAEKLQLSHYIIDLSRSRAITNAPCSVRNI